jgi:hypothetical protein
MPKFSSVEVLFKRTPEGWTFNSPYPRILGPRSAYLLTESQKATLEERLNRVHLVILVLAFMLVALSVVPVLVRFPDFAHQLEAGTPWAWLLFSVNVIVVATVLIPAIIFAQYIAVRPVLRAASRIGSAQTDWIGFSILLEMIKRYTERKSVKALIIWISILLLLSAYGTIVSAVVPAWSVLTLFGIVVSWSVTLCYAALLAFKLRAQRLRR